MSTDNRDALLIGYLEGDLPPEEQRRVERWLEEDPAFARECEELRRLDGSLYRTAEAAWLAAGVRELEERGANRSDLAMAGAVGLLGAPQTVAPQAAGTFRWLPRWTQQALPVAAAFLLLVGAASWIWMQREGRAPAGGGKPLAAALIQESNSANWVEGIQLETQRPYQIGPGTMLTLSLAGNGNSVLYLRGPVEITFTRNDMVNQRGGAVFYKIRSGTESFKATLTDDARVLAASDGAEFEFVDGVLRLKNGSLVLNATYLEDAVTLKPGDEIDLEARERQPQALSPEQRQAIGAWTGQTGRNAPGGPAFPEPAAQEGESASTPRPVLERRELALLAHRDSLAVAIAEPPRDLREAYRLNGPAMMAWHPGSHVPTAVVQSDQPELGAALISNAVAGSFRTRGEESAVGGFRYRTLSPQAGSPLAASGAETGIYGIYESLALLLPTGSPQAPPLDAILAMDPSTSVVGGSPLGKWILDPANEQADIVFAADLDRWLQGRFGGVTRMLAPFTGDDLALRGTGRYDGPRMVLSGTVTAAKGALGSDVLTEQGDLSLLRIVPNDVAVAVTATVRDPRVLLDRWNALLAMTLYGGDMAAMQEQLKAFEGDLGFSLREELLPALDGRVIAAARHSYGGSAPGVVLAFGVRDATRAEELLLRRLPSLQTQYGRARGQARGADRTQALPASFQGSRWRWEVGDGTLRLMTDESMVLRESGASVADMGSVVSNWTHRQLPDSAFLMASPRRLALLANMRIEDGPPSRRSGQLLVAGIAPAAHGYRFALQVPGTFADASNALQMLGAPGSQNLEVRTRVRQARETLERIETALVAYRQREGRLPEILDALVESKDLPYALQDPFDANRLWPRYEQVAGGGWRIWSIGPDRTDNNAELEWQDNLDIFAGGDLVRSGR